MISDSYDGVVERSMDMSYVVRDLFFYMFMCMNWCFCYYLIILIIFWLVCVDFYGYVCWFWYVDCELGDYDDDVNCDSN